ncbi:hypothetical protein LZ32DRAFT_324770 [Colletotrichum eremochloae]|nr:hypothetical protein LZ32DRAFT_324770 [Colletotrichum eremochloae]
MACLGLSAGAICMANSSCIANLEHCRSTSRCQGWALEPQPCRFVAKLGQRCKEDEVHLSCCMELGLPLAPAIIAPLPCGNLCLLSLSLYEGQDRTLVNCSSHSTFAIYRGGSAQYDINAPTHFCRPMFLTYTGRRKVPTQSPLHPPKTLAGGENDADGTRKDWSIVLFGFPGRAPKDPWYVSRRQQKSKLSLP